MSIGEPAAEVLLTSRHSNVTSEAPTAKSIMLPAKPLLFAKKVVVLPLPQPAPRLPKPPPPIATAPERAEVRPSSEPDCAASGAARSGRRREASRAGGCME
jgi:hypothetical protein